MLNILPIPANDVIMYLNIAFIGFIVLGALIGFTRGTMKSTYFAIMTIIIFVSGWLLMGPISNKLLGLDFSKFGWEIDGIAFNSPLQFAHDYVEFNYPEYVYLFTEGSYSLELIKGLIDIVFKIVYVLLLVILSFTVFWLINALLWLVIRIPFRKLLCKPTINKKGKSKYKVKALSRLGGAGIGAVKGLMYTLLLGFIFAGLASVTDSIRDIALSEDTEAVVVVNGDSFTVIDLNTEEGETSPDANQNPQGGNSQLDDIFTEYEDVFEVISGYRKTISGTVFGAIKVGENKTSFDEYIFDTIFSVKVKDTKIKLRNELRTLARALSSDAVKQLMTDGFDITKLTELSDEDLKELIETISSLKTFKVVFPVGIELITYSNILESALGDQYQTIKDLLQANLEDLLKIDACKQIESLGYVFVDVLDLLGDNLKDPSKINYLTLDQNTLNDMFDKLAKMDIVKVAAPIAISYMLNSESIKASIQELGFDIADLELDKLTGDDLSNELLNLPKIYEKVAALGLKMVDGKVDLTEIDPTKVEALTTQIFESKIISKAMPVVVNAGFNYLNDPTNPEMQKIYNIFKDDIKGEIVWKDELSPLLTAAASLIKSGIIDSTDPMLTLKNMQDSDFEDLGKYLSQSKLITNNLNELIEVLVPSDALGGITLVGLDETKGETWNEKEIVSLFKSVKVILNSGIIDSSDPMEALKTLTDETIDSLALNLSNSKFITKNLNGIIDVLMTNSGIEGIEIVGLDASKGENWDEVELKSLFGAFKTILSTNLISSPDPVEAFKNITDADIDKLSTDLSTSKFFTKNLNGVITFAITQLDGTLQLEALDETKGERWDKTEIKAVLSSVKTIVETGVLDQSSDPLQNVKAMKDQTIENLANSLSSSKFMTKNISNLVGMFTGELGFELAKLNQEEWTTSEIYSVFKSVTIVADAAGSDGNIDVESILNLKEEQLGVLLESKLLTETLKNVIVEKSKPGQELEILKGVYADGVDANGEKLYDWQDNKKNAISNVGSDGILNITPVTNALKYIVYKNDCYFTSTVSNLTIDLKTVNPEYTYSANDKFSVKAILENGELRRAFNAISALELSNIQTGVNIDLRLVINKKDTLFESFILTETLIDQIRNQSTSKGGVLEVSNDFLEGGSGEWRGSNGELNHIIDALDVALGISTSTTPVYPDSIDPNNINLNNIIDGRATLLKSNILSDTVIVQIQKVNGNGLTLADEYLTKDFSVWKDSSTGPGELNILLGVLGDIMDFEGNGFNIDPNTINLAKIISGKNEILKSAVITTTVVNQLSSMSDVIIVPNEYKITNNTWENGYNLWKNTYKNGVVEKEGELASLFNSLYITLGLTKESNLTINDIKVENITLNNIYKGKDNILKSAILTSTIVDNIVKLDTVLKIPADYQITDNSYQTGYNLWKNTYTDGKVSKRGELDKVFNALNAILNLETGPEIALNNTTSIQDNINLKKIVDNSNTIFESIVLSSTVINEVQKVPAITLPTEYSNPNDYSVWFDTNELNHLIDSIGLIIPLDSVTDFNIDPNTIDMKVLLNSKDEILKSAVLTSTVVNNINSLGGTITIPNEYLITTDKTYATGYKLWKNTYKVDGKVATRGELSYTLGALDALLGITDNPNPVTINDLSTLVNDIYLEPIINNKDIILHSNIINMSIATQIKNLTTGIYVPNDLKYNDQGWKNEYDSNDKVIYQGETSRLLSSLQLVMGLTETGKTSVNNLSLEKFTIGNVTSDYNRDKILYSSVISETLKGNLIELANSAVPLIYLPKDYEIESSPNHFVWNNTYDETGKLTKTGELSALLSALNKLVDANTRIDMISTIDYKAIFEKPSQDEILKSKVLSETIISTLINSTGSGTSSIPVEIPNIMNLKNPSDRSSWYNVYDTNGTLLETKELANLINSLNALLGKAVTDLDNISIYDNLDSMLKQCGTDSYKNDILKSMVVSETLRINLSHMQLAGDYITNAFKKNGLNYNDLNNWYGLDSMGKPEHKELWNFLTSASLILYYGTTENTFDDLSHFTIENLLGNTNMIPEIDPINYTVKKSNIEVMLRSMIVENIFADLASTLTSGELAGIIVEPMGGYNWYKNDGINDNKEHDLRTFLESYYIIQQEINLSDIASSANVLLALGDGAHDVELGNIATGMVISRVFRNSAPSMFNGIFEIPYQAIYDKAILLPEYVLPVPMKTWDEVKFKEADYEESRTNLEARTSFINSYKGIYGEMMRVKSYVGL